MADVTQEQLVEWEAQHKRIAHMKAASGNWEIVLRKPTRAEYKRFRAMSNDDAQKADATEVLVRSCRVYPSAEALEALLEDYPAIPEACSPAVLKLLDTAAELDAKS